MPRYFFNLRNSSGYLEDEEGQDLPDAGSARQAAMTSARSIVSEESRKGVIDLRASIEIRDEAGAMVLEMPFGDAVEIMTGVLPSGGQAGGKA
jgi:hypothetical protein